MSKVRVKAYAKVNLTLDITGAQNGYHMLESLVATVDLFDTITAQSRKDDKINVIMRGMGSEGIASESNNACIAANLFQQRFGCGGADIYIDKNIPMGAGLGGSSADAAGVLNALSAMYGIRRGAALKQIADKTGSDAGYMLCGGFAVISGRGEAVRRVESCERLNLLLCIPNAAVSTAECYARYDGLGVKIKPSTARAEQALISGNLEELGKALSNALFPAARTLSPQTESAYAAMLQTGALGVNMSGSGSCVYALCENDQFCAYCQSRYRGNGRLIRVKTVTPEYDFEEDIYG